jgi:hypothetical protein
MIDGVISSREILHQPALIARLFGMRVLARCLLAIVRREQTTFLALLCRPHEHSRPAPAWPLIRRARNGLAAAALLPGAESRLQPRAEVAT